MTRERLIGGAVVLGLVLITVLLYVESLTATTNAQIVGFQHTSDPRRLVIVVAMGRLDDIAEREITETSDAVRITARKRTSSGSGLADLQYFPITVTLRTVLGDRAVLDDKGVALPDLGEYSPPRRTASP